MIAYFVSNFANCDDVGTQLGFITILTDVTGEQIGYPIIAANFANCYEQYLPEKHMPSQIASTEHLLSNIIYR